MSRPIDRVAAVAGLLAILLATPAWAQATQARPDTPPAVPAARVEGSQDQTPPEPPLTVQQVEQEFDNFALGQARRTLNLTEGQFFRFARAYRALQIVRRRALRQRRALLSELAPLLRGPGPVGQPALVEAKIAALDALLVSTAQEVRRAYAVIDRTLNLRQRARFRQFEQQMELKKLELLARAQAAGRAPGPGRRR